VLGSVQPQPLEFEPDGTLDLVRVAACVKPADSHFARTRLLCLENTQAGKPLPLDYLERAAAFARGRGLGLHLDGARLCNAAVAQNIPVTDISRQFDSVSVCLSKGLGAPVGSVLCGSREIIGRARRWRKVLGGGMRQAGILAAAGIVALERNVERLEEDHENARILAERLAQIEGVFIDAPSVRTNMVFVSVDAADAEPLRGHLAARGIVVPRAATMRLVTHLDISRRDLDRVSAGFASYFSA
jgi:threonine aldolase